MKPVCHKPRLFFAALPGTGRMSAALFLLACSWAAAAMPRDAFGMNPLGTLDAIAPQHRVTAGFIADSAHGEGVMNLGELTGDSLQRTRTVDDSGRFEDVYRFALSGGSASNLEADVTSLVGGGRRHEDAGILSGLTVTLWDAAGHELADSNALAALGRYDALDPGHYFLHVSGRSRGEDGRYEIDLLRSPSPMPEPGSWAQMLAGLVTLGGIVALRRRGAAGNGTRA